MQNQGINNRLYKLIRDRFGDNISEFSRKTGIVDGTIRQWFYRRSPPGAEHIAQICLTTGCSPYWLLLGIGPMFLEADLAAVLAKLDELRELLQFLQGLMPKK